MSAKAYPSNPVDRSVGGLPPNRTTARRAGILRWYPLPRTGKGQRGRTRPRTCTFLSHDADSTRSQGHVALRRNVAPLGLAPARRLPREAAQRPLRQALPLPCNCRLPTNQPWPLHPTRWPISSPRLNLRRGRLRSRSPHRQRRTAISARGPTHLPPAGSSAGRRVTELNTS